MHGVDRVDEHVEHLVECRVVGIGRVGCGQPVTPGQGGPPPEQGQPVDDAAGQLGAPQRAVGAHLRRLGRRQLAQTREVAIEELAWVLVEGALEEVAEQRREG